MSNTVEEVQQTKESGARRVRGTDSQGDLRLACDCDIWTMPDVVNLVPRHVHGQARSEAGVTRGGHGL